MLLLLLLLLATSKDVGNARLVRNGSELQSGWLVDRRRARCRLIVGCRGCTGCRHVDGWRWWSHWLSAENVLQRLIFPLNILQGRKLDAKVADIGLHLVKSYLALYGYLFKLLCQACIDGSKHLSNDMLDYNGFEVLAEDLVQSGSLFAQVGSVLVRLGLLCLVSLMSLTGRLFGVPVDGAERATMDGETIRHDSDKLGMNLVLMLLEVATQLVKLGEQDGLLG